MSTPHDCPKREDLQRYHSGDLPGPDAESIRSHLESCTRCHRVLDELDDDTDDLLCLLREPLDQEQLRVDDEFVSRTIDRLRTRMSTEAFPPEVGPYRVLGPIGRGGMGLVYRGIHRDLNKTFAIKLLPREAVDDPDRRQRFRREMLAVGRVEHANIVRATDANTTSDTPYLAMEFVDGKDLRQIARDHGRIDLADACEIIRQAACGLQHIHERQLVHRDVKPPNLMINREGCVKVLDLGLAVLADIEKSDQVTFTGGVVGTWNYMAPEQTVDSRDVDARTDIFALGATFYELLSGHAPFAHVSSEAKPQAIREQPHPNLREQAAVPADVAAIIDRMLAKQRENRFPNAAELIEAIAPFCKSANLKGLLAQTASPKTEPHEAEVKANLKSGDGTIAGAKSKTDPVASVEPASTLRSPGNESQSAPSERAAPPNASTVQMIEGSTAEIGPVRLPDIERNRGKQQSFLRTRFIQLGLFTLVAVIGVAAWWSRPNPFAVAPGDSNEQIESQEKPTPPEPKPTGDDSPIRGLRELESDIAQTITGRRFYVDPIRGDDLNSGRSWENAWKTHLPFATYNYLSERVTRLVDRPPDNAVSLKPGDAVFFGPGNYTAIQLFADETNADLRQALHLKGVKGTAEAPIHLIGLPGAVLQPSTPIETTRYGIIEVVAAIRLHGCEHFQIQGLEVCAPDGGIELYGCKSIEIHDCWFHDINGWRSNQVGAITVTHCVDVEIHDVFVTNPNANFVQWGSIPNGGFAAASLVVKNDSDRVRIHHSKFVHDADHSGDSRPIIDAATYKGVVVHHNVLIGGESSAIDTNSQPLSIHHNLFVDCGAIHKTDPAGTDTTPDCLIAYNTLNRTARFGAGVHDLCFSAHNGVGAIGKREFVDNIVVGARPYRPDQMTASVARYTEPGSDRNRIRNAVRFDRNVFFNPFGVRFSFGEEITDSLTDWQELGFGQNSRVVDPQLDSVSFWPGNKSVSGGFYDNDPPRLTVANWSYEIDEGVTIKLSVTRNTSTNSQLAVRLRAPDWLVVTPMEFTMETGERTRTVNVELSESAVPTARWAKLTADAEGYSCIPTWIVHRDHKPAPRAVSRRIGKAPENATIEELIGHSREQKRAVDVEGLIATLKRIRQLNSEEAEWLLRLAEAEDVLASQLSDAKNTDAAIIHLANAGNMLREYLERTKPEPYENDRFSNMLANSAWAAAHQGDRQATIELLRTAVLWGFDDADYLTREVAFRTMQKVPEFAAIVKQLQPSK